MTSAPAAGESNKDMEAVGALNTLQMAAVLFNDVGLVYLMHSD